MSGSQQPSREELLALIEAQARTIEELRGEVAELKRRLGRNSGNSSQPPSADAPTASPSRMARRRSGRKPGKQPGAGGSALFQTSDPDEVVDHVPDACSGCGTELAGANVAGMVRRQVHDIPTIRPVVVEHRLHQKRCGCGATTTAAAPAGVGAAAVYGPNLRALAVYLLVFQHVPVARTAQLIADVTGARPSTGLDQLGADHRGRAAGRGREADQISDRARARDPRRRDQQQHQRGPGGGCTSRAPRS
ncbi:MULTISPECIES: DUF6444 domain-containing protein [unclassified Pseudonocardia]|uniref:DUF6444 domain-containing protein n=1 Tax=unclassified Pseudonocardia TaxID=2619320 RepID=UPI000760C4D6|nr:MULTISPECIES: DUF6444 domain-containing protein [unclassified Pseudonocardia]